MVQCAQVRYISVTYKEESIMKKLLAIVSLFFVISALKALHIRQYMLRSCLELTKNSLQKIL